jgi:nitroimidazol reductase NimA-like FMN-containing flavoprotein (pyridoxamine 5'-phosphate oxidase superfamily)
MEKEEYDRLIKENYVSRIAFKGGSHPYVAPFLYVFDGRNLFFLSTKYGRKIHYFSANPNVAVEIERFSADMASYMFVTLLGRLAEVADGAESQVVRQLFVDMIKTRALSSNAVAALGHSPAEPLESIIDENRSLIWKLEKVEEIIALKNG